MGWNDSRATLLAPGWTLVTDEKRSGRGRTLAGMPVRVLRLQRVGRAETKHIRPEDVTVWLEQRGFTVSRLPQDRLRYYWEDVEALLGVEEEELVQIRLTFRLTRDSPARWPVWKGLVEQLCEAWGLGLYVSDVSFTIEGRHLLRVLEDTRSWKEFAANFHWPPVKQS